MQGEKTNVHPQTRYAKSGEVHVAYQVFGDGPVDLVFVPGFVSHIENYWDDPNLARWLNRLGSFARVVMFDKRGTGLSDRMNELPDLDQRMDDVRAVMDATGLERAVVFGISEGGSLASLFAATHPERCEALILYGAFAQFSSWIPNDEGLEQFIEYIDTSWGSGESMPMFAPSMASDPAFKQWWGKFERLGANPGAAIALMRMNSQIDITDILPTIHVPTLVIHRTEDVTIDVEGGRNLAASIPNARYVELPGNDHLPFVSNTAMRIAEEMEVFVTGSRIVANIDRVLATVLFTDIVDSTARAEALGDQAWSDLRAAHDKAVRQQIERYRGNVVKSLGDGFLATFDGPARAIHCGLGIRNALKPLGIEVRIGAHTGEVEFMPDDIIGIAVHIASRVAGLGSADDILVSRTVKDLVAGSGISLKDFGTHELKGLPDAWQLYRVSV